MSVKKIVHQILDLQNYITIDELMRIALNGYANSYYRRHDPIGKDFVTAPEISQMFGEIIAIWCIESWQNNLQENFNLIELGPGHGKLMFNLLSTVQKIQPEFLKNLKQIVLLEINHYLRAQQVQNLATFADKIKYVDSVDELPGSDNIIIANEFLDALPIKQYRKLQNSWFEVIVKKSNEKLYFDTIQIPSPELNGSYLNSQNGDVVEICHEANNLVRKLSSNFKNTSALIIDYGYDIAPDMRNNYISTLQSVKDHKYCDVLDNLGIADLTAHVDFFELKQIVKNNASYKLRTQKDFLKFYGIDLRFEQLSFHNPDLRNLLVNQYQRLVNDMGDLFKVLILENF